MLLDVRRSRIELVSNNLLNRYILLIEQAFTVTEINNYIKSLLDGEATLRNVQIVGEVSNFKRYPSGHCYFTLKDSGAVLKCVMFRGKAMSMKFEPQNGDTVLAIGRITVYERDGVYQLYTDMLLPQGVGDLMVAYEKLKAKLEAEGLFASERKQELPMNPKTIGIITSPVGAAVRDVITVSRRRNRGIKLLLFPVKVQGEGAAKEIARAISFFNKHNLADVLIVGRGGGSIEELWAFNEEETVRAVAASAIPIVSAVGHETDFTLCDFAADKRAATPSQAAELAVADAEGYIMMVENLSRRCRNLMTTRLEQEEYRLDRAKNSWALKDPERIFADGALRTDAAYTKLVSKMDILLKQSRHNFELQAARLDNLSPLAVLARGYSVTQKEDYKVVTSIEQVRWGEELITTVGDGKIVSVVQSVEEK
ncbi:MAG: exodeoxyribonuclease VII large subunit [Phascolarctobacterium sp.]|nr:exodeoxyribonuclease VII large subunit [Phascolarctobacterium sp.]